MRPSLIDQGLVWQRQAGNLKVAYERNQAEISHGCFWHEQIGTNQCLHLQ